MKVFWGKTLLLILVFGSVSCERVKKEWSAFFGAKEEVELLADSESLAGMEGLPVVKSFGAMTPATMGGFIGAGDRISVVEFYSDT